jgi:cation transporter-like permease
MDASIKARLTFAVTLMISATLCLVVIGMVTGLLIGLFDEKVDNNKIFEMISPAFQTVVGGFIGLLAGVKLSHDEVEPPRKQKD